MTLGAGQKGKSYFVDTIEDVQAPSRIGEMGLFSGVEIKMLFSAPLGDPIAIEVGSMVLCIRKEDALQIKVVEK